VIAAMFQAGREAWPDLRVDRAAFEAFVAARTPDTAQHAADLYLACACHTGDPVALAAFERTYLAQVPEYLRRVRATPELVAEVGQSLRERLFVGEAPRIAEYTGRGALGAWLRVAALRIASNARRASDTRERIEARAPAPAALPIDPELALVRSRHAPDFERALRDAFVALEERERNLLRLHFLDGLGSDGLAAVFAVHRATAARWLAAAREALQARVLELLRERLALAPRDLASLARIVRSELDMSLRGLLATDR